MLALPEVVEVVMEPAHVDEPLDEVRLQGHEEAEGRDTRDAAREGLAEVPLHELDLLEGHGGALRLFGGPLRRARALGYDDQVLLVLERGWGAVDEHVRDDPMHQEVGVAPDGRREVEVRRGGEAEVPEVLGVVAGLLHRPQDERRHERLLRPSPDGLEERLHVGRHERPAAGHPQAEAGEGVGEELHLLGSRGLVHTVQAGEPASLEIAGDDLVGEHHVVLDQPVALEPLPPLDVDRKAVFVEEHPRLREVEVEGAPIPPPGADRAREIVERPERAVHGVRDRAGPLEHRLGLLVRQGVRAADQGPLVPACADPTVGVELEKQREREPRLVPHEGAHVTREHGRQHGNRPVDEVDARPA